MGDESSMIKIGPMVCSKNDYKWDEKGHNNIVQIFVSHDSFGINSIQFQYAEKGGLVMSEKHGGNGLRKFDVVRLNHPKEYITWISGQVESNSSSKLCSITFGTNHGEYGPFGPLSAHNRDFCFKLGQDRQFGGFYGTVGHFSDAISSIGVYLKPNITLARNTNVKEENA